jgi:hypothetical protein
MTRKCTSTLIFYFLKKIIRDKIPKKTILLEIDGERKIILEPKTIIEIRIKKLQN